MRRCRLLLVHHFPLSSVTGVTVMLAEMLRLVPVLDPGIVASYLSYEGIAGPRDLEAALEAEHGAATCVVGVNLHIEVQWELSLALARWCARRAIPLYDNVQDYWPHHRESMGELTGAWGVRLAGSSPFILDSLAGDRFPAGLLPMGAQLPPAGPPPPGPPAVPVLGSVGRLVRRKRFPDVVRAFCGAGLDRTAQLRLTLLPSQVFGSGEDAEQLRRVQAELERPGVRGDAVQLVRTATVPPEYGALAAYVLGSDYEGFSMTPFEAAYVGCPPIVSDIPPHRSMAEALFGERAEAFLYPVADTAALGQRMADELATGRRRRHLAEHREPIRRIIEDRFSVRTTARALARLCRDGGRP